MSWCARDGSMVTKILSKVCDLVSTWVATRLPRYRVAFDGSDCCERQC